MNEQNNYFDFENGANMDINDPFQQPQDPPEPTSEESASQSTKPQKHSHGKNMWTPEEDQKLIAAVEMFQIDGQIKNWSQVAAMVPGRNNSQCSARYKNVLHPALQKSDWTQEELEKLNQLFPILGKSYTLYQERLPGRSYQQIKNKVQSLINKKNSKRKSNPPSTNVVTDPRMMFFSQQPSPNTFSQSSQGNLSFSPGAFSQGHFDFSVSAISGSDTSVFSLTDQDVDPVFDQFWE